MVTDRIIRQAEERDIPVIVNFNLAMAKETEDLDLDRQTLEKGVKSVMENPEKGFYLVNELSGIVRASLLVTYEWSDWRNGTFFWVQSVYVEKDFRQQGLYKELYKYLQNQISKKDKIAGLRLYVEKDNVAAQAAYKKLGMEKTDYLLFEEALVKN